MHACNICNELSLKSALESDRRYVSLVQSGDTRILETDNFVVLPSVGPIDSLHAMVVPRVHVNSFSTLPRSAIQEAHEILEQLRQFVEQVHSRKLVFFESGAGTLSDHSGGCIVHAHIHALSSCPSFSERLRREVALELQDSEEPLARADRKFGYVWFVDEEKREYICNQPLLPSQFLRYLYSQCCAAGSTWNWRRHPNVDGIFEVLRNYRGLT
ncbi:HIT domain-containing protein [Burkholderia contaminans]|uniref:HIT domain-containing protein n=1 Tax=Burkholderia contaminans TaxID=488447 RepID=UPI001CF54FEB|nr:HIT domain-containing protein [Burkholderia contaminans]